MSPASSTAVGALSFALGCLALGCGGIAIDDSQNRNKGAGVGAADGRDAGDDEAAAASPDGEVPPIPDASVTTDAAVDSPQVHEAGMIFETGWTCSMPVGTPASGCPTVLAPVCPIAFSYSGLGIGGCEYPVEQGVDSLSEEQLAYVDIVVGELGTPDAGRMLRVADAAGCAVAGNGWYFDDPKHPTMFHLCPEACECGKASQAHYWQAVGCWGNAAPGVLEAKMACPRCSAARPKTCGSAQGGWGYGIPMCEFPLKDPSAPFADDPLKTNLKYVQHGATAGGDEPWDGYLTYVPSLAYCDYVEEGWTLDMSTEPPTVQVCPSACSCVKSEGAMLMVEHGCPRHEAEGL